MCFILESSDGFWLWPRMRCVLPDDTYFIPMLCALSSQCHFLGALPIGLSNWWPRTSAVSKRGQQVPSEEAGSSESPSSPLSAAPTSFSCWWARSTGDDQLLIMLLESAEHTSPTAFIRSARGMGTHLPQSMKGHTTAGSVHGCYSVFSSYKYSMRVKSWNEKSSFTHCITQQQSAIYLPASCFKFR